MNNLQIINEKLNEIGYSLDVRSVHPYNEICPQYGISLEYNWYGGPKTPWISYVNENNVEFIIKEIALRVYGLCHLLGDDKALPHTINFTMEDGKLILNIEKVSKCEYRGRFWLVRTNITSTNSSQYIKLTYWTDEVPYEMYDYVDGVLCTRRSNTMRSGVIDEYVAEQTCLMEQEVWSEVKYLDEKIRRTIATKESERNQSICIHKLTFHGVTPDPINL